MSADKPGRKGAMSLRRGVEYDLGRPADGQPWRAILISDTHVAHIPGDSYFPREAERAMLKALPQILSDSGGADPVRQAFVLGDVFHGSLATDEWRIDWVGELMEAMSSVPVVVAIGGNHDRQFWDSCAATLQAKYPRLRVLTGPCVLKVRSAGGETAWLTHDAGNNLWLSPVQVLPFLSGIKDAHGIGTSELLVTGHTHRVTDNSSKPDRMASLGCFTGCSKHSPGLDYGTLFETPQGAFDFHVRCAKELNA